MTLPLFWRKRRTSASAEDRLGSFRKVFDRKLSQRFQFPLRFNGRIALLEGGFEPDGNLREFAATDVRRLREYAPEALVAPLGLALSLADQKQRGFFDLPSLNIALVVLTQFDDSPLADDHRELLWRAFGIPIFEQLRGWDGTVVARECEVHDGLHVVESAMIPHLEGEELLVTQPAAANGPVIRARTGFAGDIVDEQCECGQETPRIRNLNQIKTPIAST